MDLNRLRRLAAEVDGQHREAMCSIHGDVGAGASDGDATADRRGFLHKLGLGGTVLAVGTTATVLSARGAGAQTTTTTPGSTAPTTTTTLPPKQPTPEDLAILAFAQSLELAVVEGYRLALPKLADSPVMPVAVTFALHHEQHAQAFGGLAGKAALGIANQTLVESFGPRIEAARSEADVLRLAWQLESAAASTYVAVLSEVVSTNSAEILASIQPIEARHAAVIGQALELPLSELAPAFVSPDDAATPSEYPIIAR